MFIVVLRRRYQHLVKQLTTQFMDQVARHMAHKVSAEKKPHCTHERQRYGSNRYRDPRELQGAHVRRIKQRISRTGDDALIGAIGFIDGIQQKLQQIGQ